MVQGTYIGTTNKMITPKYALFVYDPMINHTAYAITHPSKETLISWAPEEFKGNKIFAIYKFESDTRLFTYRVPATRWALDTTFDGKDVPTLIRNYTPFERVYQIDNEWYFTNKPPE